MNLSKKNCDVPYFSIFISILLVAFFIIQGCSKDDYGSNSGNGGQPAENEIFLNASSFNPSNKTISIGTTIKWINKAGVIHNVISGTPGSPSGVFNSGDMGSNAEFTQRFDNAGTFDYYCSHHAGMTGRITVQ
jgi:plastocyanin